MIYIAQFRSAREQDIKLKRNPAEKLINYFQFFYFSNVQKYTMVYSLTISVWFIHVESFDEWLIYRCCHPSSYISLWVISNSNIKKIDFKFEILDEKIMISTNERNIIFKNAFLMVRKITYVQNLVNFDFSGEL